MNIGFFDSGIGGLSVLRESLRLLPHENYIYYADTAHVPYGTKSREEVAEYIFDAVEFLAGCSLKLLVVACNTATSIAVKSLRESYDFPVIGMEPAVKPAVEKNPKHKRVLVLATPLTLQEEKFHSLVGRVDPQGIVDYLPAPELVEFAEKFEFRDRVVLPCLREKLKSYDLEQYGTLVLGCTHFVFFSGHFRRLLPAHMDIIDGNRGTVRHMKNTLEQRVLPGSLQKMGTLKFFDSGVEVCDASRLNKFKELLGLPGEGAAGDNVPAAPSPGQNK